MIDRPESKTDDRSPEQIRREIDHTRAEMDETIDALTHRIRPGSMAEELWERVKGEGGIGDVVRQHPVPLAFVSLGLGWLVVEETTGSRRRSAESRQWRSSDDQESGRAKAKAKELASSATEKASGATRKVSEATDRAAHSAGERAGETARGAAETARDVTRRASDAVERARDEASSAVARAGDEVRDGARRLGRGAADLAEENPLALGAMAFGLGLLGGLVVPMSRAEDRAMGPASERLKDEGGRLVRHTAERAADVAGETAAAAGEELRRQTDEKEDLVDELADTAAAAAEGAEERAREAGESLREEAGEAAKPTRESAREDPDPSEDPKSRNRS